MVAASGGRNNKQSAYRRTAAGAVRPIVDHNATSAADGASLRSTDRRTERTMRPLLGGRMVANSGCVHQLGRWTKHR